MKQQPHDPDLPIADANAPDAQVATEEGRPRVLGVRFGVNPNSSSLGVDVTYLLFGGTAVVAASLMLSAWLRGRRRKVDVVGDALPEQA